MIMATELTDKQQLVYDIIDKGPYPISPTDIGMKAGKDYAQASSWANGAIKALVGFGLIQRHDGGKYSVAEED